MALKCPKCGQVGNTQHVVGTLNQCLDCGGRWREEPPKK